MNARAAAPTRESPFSLENSRAYAQWRERKLASYPAQVDALIVAVRDPRAPTAAELDQLKAVCGRANMAIYRSALGTLADKAIVSNLGRRLGLQRLTTNLLADEDGISTLQDAPEKSQRGYIPYSNKRLLWHTDGYYNTAAQAIRAFILHCVSPAAAGGDNALIDPELIYIELRDRNPDYIRALMAPDAMTIPENAEAVAAARAAAVGPVFSVGADGNLHMRYTARTRSIVWKDDADTTAAAQFLSECLNDGAPYVLRYRLAAGEGIVCNNVLHNRSAFNDDASAAQHRLLYRARYYDRIADTNTAFL